MAYFVTKTCTDILLVILLLSIAQYATGHEARLDVKVVSVRDGDTIEVNIPGWPKVVGQTMPVRLQGIDTPETYRPECDRERQLGEQATAWVRHQLSGGQRIQISYPERGSFFRFVAEVYVDGESLGPQLIDRGLAVPYSRNSATDWCP